MTGKLVVVGSYNQDFIWRTDSFPLPGETRLGQFSTGPGGKGFNQAVAAARQGAQVTFVAALGRDAIADKAVTLALAEGIDARWQWCETVPSGNAAIVLDASGQNLIVVGSGANLQLAVAHIEAQARAIAAASVLLVQHEVTPAATRRALELARISGAVTVLNPAPPLAVEDGGLLPLVDVLTPNETEFAHLLARRAGVSLAVDHIATLAEADLHQLARRLAVPTVVITLGAGGVFVSHDEAAHWRDHSAHYRVPAEKVEVRDTTGAGDAFSGSLAAALTDPAGARFETAIRYANQVAAMATESLGAALSIPRRAQVVARFRRD